jgi:hypothetical protein
VAVLLTRRGFALSAALSHTGTVYAFIGKALKSGHGICHDLDAARNPHRLTARLVIAVEVVSLLLVAALIVVIFARLGAETLRATSPGALCTHASTGNGWRRSGSRAPTASCRRL